MGEEEIFRSPNAPRSNPPRSIKHSISQPAETKEVVISPGFRSTVELAGWDEESLLASLIVEDTPERDISKRKKRTIFLTKTPPTDSRRSKKTQRRNSIPGVVLSLDDDDDGEAVKTEKKRNSGNEEDKEQVKLKLVVKEEIEKETGKVLPCMDQLREELSCAICLEICFEPSTTPCGHSFCKKCLKSAATKCGKKCPKCRQIISNGRACTVNTVLWNTVQLLFPKEVEARKATMEVGRSPETRGSSSNERSSRGRRNTRNNSSFIMSSELVSLAEFNRTMTTQISTETANNNRMTRRNRNIVSPPNQSEDAALALRLQRREFLRNRRSPAPAPAPPTVHSARANLRAIASRAMQSTTSTRNRFS